MDFYTNKNTCYKNVLVEYSITRTSINDDSLSTCINCSSVELTILQTANSALCYTISVYSQFHYK